ncbi:MAG: GtrA family protein [Paracoccaceae bacterium]
MRELGQIGRFGLVGGVGFIVDGGLLWGLSMMGWSPYTARLVSFPVAVVTTWALHRAFTFATAEKAAPRRQLGRYFGLQIVGALVNFVLFFTVLQMVGETPQTALAALAVGAASGLVVNYAGSRCLVF